MRTIEELRIAIQIAGEPDTCPDAARNLLRGVRREIPEHGELLSEEKEELLGAVEAAATKAAENLRAGIIAA